MNAELRRADETHEIRRAIARWQRGGAIEPATAEALLARWPDDRVRSRLAFRILFFFLTLFCGWAAWGTVGVLFGAALRNDEAVVLAVWSVLFAGAALAGVAFCVGRLRLRGFGVEEGLAALVVQFGAAAVFLLGDSFHLPDRADVAMVALTVVVLAALLGLGWGIVGSGLVVTGALLAFLATVPGARWIWIAVALVVLPLARSARRMDACPVAWRHRAGEVFVGFALALWIAAHPSNLLAHAFDEFDYSATAVAAEPGSLRLLFGWGLILALPLLLLASGLRRRDRLELALGAVALLAAGASAVDALDLEPAWLVLTAGGLLLGGVLFVLRRLLAASPDRTRAGFTDRPLLGSEEDGSWVELVATVVALGPGPRAPAEPAPIGQGGEFGGGGASSQF